jgi:RNA recognition motif-containing protein
MSSKLFVGNLSYSTGEAELRRAFEPIGALRSVAIITDRMTGRPRGFGFVEFERSDDAQRAITSLDGQMVDGRTISVNVARERERTPRFNEGGGGPSGGSYRPARPSEGAPRFDSPSRASAPLDAFSRDGGARDTGQHGYSGYEGTGEGGFGGGEGDGRGQRPRRGGKGSRGSNRW